MSDLEAIRKRLATIADTHNPRPSGAAEQAQCLACGARTGQVADGMVNGQPAWFVPLCGECHKTKARKGA